MGSDSNMQSIANTLLEIVTPEMSPKQLIKAARRKHPRASRKEIVRAAFYSVIAGADRQLDKAKNLHALALDARADQSGAGEN